MRLVCFGFYVVRFSPTLIHTDFTFKLDYILFHVSFPQEKAELFIYMNLTSTKEKLRTITTKNYEATSKITQPASKNTDYFQKSVLVSR